MIKKYSNLPLRIPAMQRLSVSKYIILSLANLGVFSAVSCGYAWIQGLQRSTSSKTIALLVLVLMLSADLSFYLYCRVRAASRFIKGYGKTWEDLDKEADFEDGFNEAVKHENRTTPGKT